MPKSAKAYIYGVIAVGVSLFAGSLNNWPPQRISTWLLYLVLTMLASSLKLRLPGLTRTYSLSFLFLLFGIDRLSLPEVLVAGCAGALVQSLWKAKNRPTAVQVLFNVANLTISVSIGFVAAHYLLASGRVGFRPAVLALTAFLYFVVNTVLVSGVLSLLEGKPLLEVSRDWYVWSFPYYLAGAVLVGLIPAHGQTVAGEAWLLLLPVAYLIHFFIGLLKSSPQADKVYRGEDLPPAARAYVFAVIGGGILLAAAAAYFWKSEDVLRFVFLSAFACIAATFKIRIPGLRGTISVGFVLLLVALADLSFSETVFLSAMAGIVQCVWRPKKAPTLTRTLFNGACIATSTASAYALCHYALVGWLSDSLIVALALATAVIYTINSLMIATVLCLVDNKPLRHVWQNCYFWSCPYYLMGTAAAGLMITTSRVAGWPLSLIVLPIFGLVHYSYWLHLSRTESAAWRS
jgi:hypothetical protein